MPSGKRDLIVSYYKLATFHEQAGNDAGAYWRRCHTTLRAINDAGMFLDPPLVQVLEQLDRKFGDS